MLKARLVTYSMNRDPPEFIFWHVEGPWFLKRKHQHHVSEWNFKIGDRAICDKKIPNKSFSTSNEPWAQPIDTGVNILAFMTWQDALHRFRPEVYQIYYNQTRLFSQFWPDILHHNCQKWADYRTSLSIKEPSKKS